MEAVNTTAGAAGPTTVPIEPIPDLDYLLGCVCVVCFVFGTAGNILALLYFIRKKKDVPTLVYMGVVIVDMAISIVILPVGVSFFSQRRAVFFSVQVVCDIWAIVWTTTQRLSVFMVALLAVTRAYILTFPFREVGRRLVIAIMIVGTLIHTLGSLIPLWYNVSHLYHYTVCACIAYPSLPGGAEIAVQIFDYLGVFVPVPVITVSFVITLIQLSKRTTASAGRDNDASKTSISITISLFTGTYLFFNLPSVCFILLYYLKFLPWNVTILYLINLMFILVIPLNAACNPVIYLWRMKRLRMQSFQMIRRSVRPVIPYHEPNSGAGAGMYTAATRLGEDTTQTSDL